MGQGKGRGAAGVLTDESQDDGQQGRCGEGDGHVHLQHLQQVHCGHRAAAHEGLGRAYPTPGRLGLTDEDEDLVVRVPQQHGHTEGLWGGGAGSRVGDASAHGPASGAPATSIYSQR